MSLEFRLAFYRQFWVWKDALIVILIVMAVTSYISAPFIAQDSLKTLKDNVKLQDRMGKENFDKMIRNIENPSPASIVFRSILYQPLIMLIGFLIAGVIWGRGLGANRSEPHSFSPFEGNLTFFQSCPLGRFLLATGRIKQISKRWTDLTAIPTPVKLGP